MTNPSKSDTSSDMRRDVRVNEALMQLQRGRMHFDSTLLSEIEGYLKAVYDVGHADGFWDRGQHGDGYIPE